MSRRNLEYLFNPGSVALIGASDRQHSVGATVMRNLLQGGFAGPIWPVNINRSEVAGRRAYRTIAELPGVPDLAVVCTPAPSLPGIIAELGRRGTRAAIVISAGLEQASAEGDRKSTRLNSSHSQISYAVFCLKKKNKQRQCHRRQL